MRKQLGFSFTNFILIAIVAAFLVLTFFKVVPVYSEYFSIKSAIGKVSKEKSGAPMADIRQAFDRYAEIEYFKSVKGEDLEILQENGAVSISVEYQKKVPLVANISLLFDFRIEDKGKGGE
ncbi:DUF4845 domain-containing protein [Parachitinimonas caeni]|uniref:DUF4845 domain-containing protein n=1 Tax=Parachitinimonas caeni TaxID=3031301 RepID=A0ABT7DW01_9NEIS|nr:DUF4845 domain-containing protein [Parachitinimonas caeni]MDK2124236.1 DUF4845 domain-containing protein [Parachitinimonas caeni]